MTNGILTSMKIRDRIYKSFLRSKEPNQRLYLEARYKTYRNKIVSICRQSKSNFYQKYFRENMKNISKIWKGVNNFITNKSKSEHTTLSLNIDGNVTFSSIADNIKKKIPRTPKTYKQFLKNPTRNSIFLSPVSSDEIEKCFSMLDSNKAYGPPSIPSRILTIAKKEISIPLP